MPRGGRRKGAGRKTAWVSGCSFAETTVIRVPKAIKNEVLELAHRLDAGEEIGGQNLDVVDSHQLELLPESLSHEFQDELLEKAKELIYQESIVRSRDRYQAKRLLSRLFNVDKSYFNQKK